MDKVANRGWLLDQIMLIGHYEAALTHDDEQFCNIDNDMENNSGDLTVIEKFGDELHFRTELARMHYNARVEAESDIFTAFPDIDKKKWCDLKHAAADFILAAEILHARDFNPTAQKNLVLAGKALAFLISYTFGFEPMNCLRCFNDAMAIGNTSGAVATYTQAPVELSKEDTPVDMPKEEFLKEGDKGKQDNRLKYEQF